MIGQNTDDARHVLANIVALIEALILGVATRQPDESLVSREYLDRLRQELGKPVIKT